jgi:Ca2+-binding RTX toxin-like protein
MAKIKFLQNIVSLENEFEGASSIEVQKKGKEAIWTDSESGAEIHFEGKGLKVLDGEEQDSFSGGTIERIVVRNSDDVKALVISDLNIKAEKLSATYEERGLEGLMYFVTKGNDRVTGSSGNDLILGGAGNDVMTGKGGSDDFYIHGITMVEASKGGKEKDVITDFGTEGEDRDLLYFSHDLESAKGKNNGKDTLLTFDDGSTLLLEGVKKSEWNAYVDSFEL